jgi:hypothetical protein
MKIQWHRVLGAVIVLASLAACTPYTQVKQQRLEAVPLSERGYVIGRYGVDCWNKSKTKCHQSFNALTTYFGQVERPANENEFIPGILKAEFGSILGNDTVWDIVDMESRQRWFYFCEVVRGGEQEFHGMRYWNYAGGGSGYSVPDEGSLGLRFDAPAGVVTYIGWIKAATGDGRNFVGMRLPSPLGLQVGEGSEDDYAQALQRCPAEAQALPVQRVVLDPASARHPMVGVLR